MIYSLEGRQLAVASDQYYIAPGAQLIGAVRLGVGASVWFNCVLRADDADIEVGDGSNVQDATVIHCDAGMPVRIGRNATIGHCVLLHGCTIDDESLIGNGAIVLDGVHVGRHCLIGAGSLLTPGKNFPDGSVVMGAPARIVRPCGERERALIAHAALSYQQLVQRYRRGLVTQG